MAKRSASPVNGILIIDKPAGLSSHGVVSRLRRWYGTRRIGHAGTLDPMATGVLVAGLGRGTKLLTYLIGLDKTYTATIRLGSSTPSDDADSAADRFADPQQLAAVTDAQIAAGVAQLRGPIEQVPSAVSAIKVDGQRAYQLVRAGAEVELKARPVTITAFDIHDIRRQPDAQLPAIDVDVTVSCTSGTYIRALARDLGTGLGVFGHLTALRRTHVGPFALPGHQLPDDLTAPEAVPPPEPIDLATAAAQVLPVHELSTDEARALLSGQFIDATGASGPGPWAGICAGELIAVIERRADKLKTATGIAQQPPS
ncbi:tRNA pseudouridine(55) synthase TruB [Brevibacterium otitidis]|uniref:tRNA pseudouridine synthase B n=1 Tax=Brevibacterium otitidis TaxID=53364 RepID=A0ABV5X3Y3_9MICO|nr:tRNA pseudouridine(55) synthase TruB [Brevibacterium otitidis]